MPIYEYTCTKCGKDFEILQKITDEPVASCPECGSRVTRVISRTSFTLKGGGWYKDGYASTGGGGSKKSEKKESKPKDKS